MKLFAGMPDMKSVYKKDCKSIGVYGSRIVCGFNDGNVKVLGNDELIVTLPETPRKMINVTNHTLGNYVNKYMVKY